MKIDRVSFYVEDAEQWRDWFVRVLQFRVLAGGSDGRMRAEILSSGSICFILYSPLTPDSPAGQYLRDRPPGVADVAFAVPNLEVALERARALPETRVLQPIQRWTFPNGEMRSCQIVGPASVCHTLVERQGITPILPEDWAIATDSIAPAEALFANIDHIVLNVAAGQLQRVAQWYESALGFARQQTFAIQTEKSGLFSQVLVHPESGVQIPVNEPTSSNSQIQEFLDFNAGAGVQHIALYSNCIIEAVCQAKAEGLSFLTVPPSYYDRVRQQHPHLQDCLEEWQALTEAQILIEPQSGAQGSTPMLLQIFTRPIFREPTFFFETIERRDRARGFGAGNFRALFEAIEKEQELR